eukprot:ctg_366.g214
MRRERGRHGGEAKRVAEEQGNELSREGVALEMDSPAHRRRPERAVLHLHVSLLFAAVATTVLLGGGARRECDGRHRHRHAMCRVCGGQAGAPWVSAVARLHRHGRGARRVPPAGYRLGSGVSSGAGDARARLHGGGAGDRTRSGRFGSVRSCFEGVDEDQVYAARVLTANRAAPVSLRFFSGSAGVPHDTHAPHAIAAGGDVECTIGVVASGGLGAGGCGVAVVRVESVGVGGLGRLAGARGVHAGGNGTAFGAMACRLAAVRGGEQLCARDCHMYRVGGFVLRGTSAAVCGATAGAGGGIVRSRVGERGMPAAVVLAAPVGSGWDGWAGAHSVAAHCSGVGRTSRPPDMAAIPRSLCGARYRAVGRAVGTHGARDDARTGVERAAGAVRACIAADAEAVVGQRSAHRLGYRRALRRQREPIHRYVCGTRCSARFTDRHARAAAGGGDGFGVRAAARIGLVRRLRSSDAAGCCRVGERSRVHCGAPTRADPGGAGTSTRRADGCRPTAADVAAGSARMAVDAAAPTVFAIFPVTAALSTAAAGCGDHRSGRQVIRVRRAVPRADGAAAAAVGVRCHVAQRSVPRGVAASTGDRPVPSQVRGGAHVAGAPKVGRNAVPRGDCISVPGIVGPAGGHRIAAATSVSTGMAGAFPQ